MPFDPLRDIVNVYWEMGRITVMAKRKFELGSTPSPVVYTTDEVAHQLKVTRRTVQGWIKTGKLIALRIGRDFRVEAQELEAFKERARQAVRVTLPTQAP
jgi:excisionase family DNA binding protein